MMYQAPQPRPSVLIVEDDVLVRLHAADVLAEHGFDVLEAGSAMQALSLLETRARIDVLFTDVNMPGEFDGMALARQVRARWPQTMILITSGHHRPEIGIDLGRFVPKPYVPERIAQMICAMMRERAAPPCPTD